MTAAIDAEACAVVATAADIICSLRAADLAGWTPPWRNEKAPADASAGNEGDAQEQLAWPAVARGKRSRSRRGSSPSASAGSGSVVAAQKKKKARRARGSPASPLDYSAGSGASSSGGEDGGFCSPPPPVVMSSSAGGGGGLHAKPSSKVGLPGCRTILPVPPPRPAGQRPRKKMRLPEIQQMVRSLSVENDALRQEMKALQKACTALSTENGKLETRIDQLSDRDRIIVSKPEQPDQRASEPEAQQNGFELPDLNLPAQDG